MKTESPRILFVIKKGQYPYRAEYSTSDLSREGHSGLYWSSKFVADMLAESGVDVKFIEVIDNSFIDHEIQKFQPTTVVIEALWVVPEKFAELQILNPTVRFVVLLHSETPFLADEPIAVRWIKAYADLGVTIAVNSLKMLADAKTVLRLEGDTDRVIYLPDFYPVRLLGEMPCNDSAALHIGCFGAIRPLKNQLIQAIAAIRFANRAGVSLSFHVNGMEVDAGGQPILENLRALFAGTPHTLVEDRWVDHKEFLESLRHIDFGMQVSFTETFDIVAADMISSGVPTVVSPEVVWASPETFASPTDSFGISEKLRAVWKNPMRAVKESHRGLKTFVDDSKILWLRFVRCSE
jgi:hypothetical protein